MRNELLEEFAGFTELDSVSFGERRMADLLKEKLKALGFETEEDDAGSHYGGNAGNVYGFLKCSAHLKRKNAYSAFNPFHK